MAFESYLTVFKQPFQMSKDCITKHITSKKEGKIKTDNSKEKNKFKDSIKFNIQCIDI